MVVGKFTFEVTKDELGHTNYEMSRKGISQEEAIGFLKILSDLISQQFIEDSRINKFFKGGEHEN